jgi:hypothetical protein
MRTVHRDGVDNFKMGLGWRIEQLLGIEIVWTGGASYGPRTFSGLNQKSHVGVVVLSNYNSGSDIDDIGRHLLNLKALVDGGRLVKPQERTAVTVAPEFWRSTPAAIVSPQTKSGRYGATAHASSSRNRASPNSKSFPRGISPRATMTSFRRAPTRYSLAISQSTIHASRTS